MYFISGVTTTQFTCSSHLVSLICYAGVIFAVMDLMETSKMTKLNL